MKVSPCLKPDYRKIRKIMHGQNENIKKEIKTIKKKTLELKSTTTDIQNLPEGLNSKSKLAKGEITNFKDRSTERI